MAVARFSVYAFTTIEGKPFSVSKINRAFGRAKILAKIERRCRFKDLRHTFGSNLASRGISLQKIARAMGHASTRTTERYAKPSAESLLEIAAALDFGAEVRNSAFFSASSDVSQTPQGAETTEKVGAGNGDRTRDIQLGKLTLYQLSYARARAEI